MRVRATLQNTIQSKEPAHNVDRLPFVCKLINYFLFKACSLAFKRSESAVRPKRK
jgi:hypothetical protein